MSHNQGHASYRYIYTLISLGIIAACHSLPLFVEPDGLDADEYSLTCVLQSVILQVSAEEFTFIFYRTDDTTWMTRHGKDVCHLYVGVSLESPTGRKVSAVQC